MEKRRNLSIEVTILIAALALCSLTLFGASKPGNPEEVLLTGWLHVEDRYVGDLVLVVELDGERCSYAEVLTNGRFIISVPLGSEVLLAFIKPGHLSKEISVSTRNALNTRQARHDNRTVKFDVVLESMEKRAGRSYKGPVGSLSFVNGSGYMMVRHDPKLVAADPEPKEPVP